MSTIYPQCDERLLAALRNTKAAILIAHKNPDGDALYSTLGMEAVLTSLGIETEAVNDGPFLRDDIKMLEPRFKERPSDEFIKKNPLVVVLDCSTPDRPGEAFKAVEHLERVVIDHHSSGVPFAKEGMSYIVPRSPSTTILVDIVREALGVPLDKQIASYLYRGFATDTGFYHFLSAEVAAETLPRVAAFASQGISPYEVYDEMHDGKSLSEIKDTAAVISSAEPYLDGKLLIAVQPESMAEERLSDGVYASLLETDGIEAVVLIKERPDATEIGFRSKNRSSLDVGVAAAELGGGGHKKAAGATIERISIDEAKKMLIDLIARHLGM